MTLTTAKVLWQEAKSAEIPKNSREVEKCELFSILINISSFQ